MQLNYDNVTIKQFRAKDEDGLQDVIKFVEWEYAWTHEDFPGSTVTSVFVTPIPKADANNFVVLEDITKETLCNWINSVEEKNLERIYESVVNSYLPHQYELDQTKVYHLG